MAKTRKRILYTYAVHYVTTIGISFSYVTAFDPDGACWDLKESDKHGVLLRVISCKCIASTAG